MTFCPPDTLSVLPCYVCKWDLNVFLADPGDSNRFELEEGELRAKLLISTVDNTSVCSSPCQSESVNLPVLSLSLSLLMYSTAVLGSQGYQEVSLWEGCTPVQLVCLSLSTQSRRLFITQRR